MPFGQPQNRQGQHATMQGKRVACQTQLSPGNPTLPQVNQIEIDDKGKQCEQQIDTLSIWLTWGRVGDSNDDKVDGSCNQSEAPRQFAVRSRRLISQQSQGTACVHHLWVFTS